MKGKAISRPSPRISGYLTAAAAAARSQKFLDSIFLKWILESNPPKRTVSAPRRWRIPRQDSFSAQRGWRRGRRRVGRRSEQRKGRKEQRETKMDHRATKTSITGTAEKTPPPPPPQVTPPPSSALPLSSPNPIPFGARDRPVQRADARRAAGSGQRRRRRRRRVHAHALGSSHVPSFVDNMGKTLESTSASPSVTAKTSTNADVSPTVLQHL